jgi:hypothetical protein
VQWRSHLWLKLSFCKYSQILKNTLHGHPFFAIFILIERNRPPRVMF